MLINQEHENEHDIEIYFKRYLIMNDSALLGHSLGHHTVYFRETVSYGTKL